MIRNSLVYIASGAVIALLVAVFLAAVNLLTGGDVNIKLIFEIAAGVTLALLIRDAQKAADRFFRRLKSSDRKAVATVPVHE